MSWCLPISSLSSRCRINHEAAPPLPLTPPFPQQQGRNLQDYFPSLGLRFPLPWLEPNNYKEREALWIRSVSSSSCSAMTVVDAESRFHVLAVDDSLIDRKLIEMLLKTSSYQVTTVDSGSKALELLGLRDEGDDSSSPSSSPPDHQEIDVNLIITDYCMPGMTGYDLLKRVKGSSLLKDIPVVIMSSENVPARINRCLEDGAEEFFLKPVKLADMKKLKSHLLKRKQPKPQPQPQEQPPLKANETAAEVTADGTISDCSGGGNKRKAAAMEQEGLSSPDRTKPRLSSSSSSSSLAVET